jgi:hypothetical protein
VSLNLGYFARFLGQEYDARVTITTIWTSGFVFCQCEDIVGEIFIYDDIVVNLVSNSVSKPTYDERSMSADNSHTYQALESDRAVSRHNQKYLIWKSKQWHVVILLRLNGSSSELLISPIMCSVYLQLSHFHLEQAINIVVRGEQPSADVMT